MLFTTYLDVTLKCLVAFYVFFFGVALTAYRINSRRAANDPKKRYYHPLAVALAPFIFLVCVPLGIALFILAALLYAVFLIFFVLLLVALRRPFLLIWWNKFAMLVGEPLLRIGTYLILLPFRLLSSLLRPGRQPTPA
jgi:hypothetical protein